MTLLLIDDNKGNFVRASELRYAVIPELERKLPSDTSSNSEAKSAETLIHDAVTPDDIANVVSRMTGIPVRVNFLTNDVTPLIHLIF